jgi:hypothetical protein
VKSRWQSTSYESTASSFSIRESAQQYRRQPQHEARNGNSTAPDIGSSETPDQNHAGEAFSYVRDADGKDEPEKDQEEDSNSRFRVNTWRRYIPVIDALGTILAMVASAGSKGTQ